MHPAIECDARLELEGNCFESTEFPSVWLHEIRESWDWHGIAVEFLLSRLIFENKREMSLKKMIFDFYNINKEKGPKMGFRKCDGLGPKFSLKRVFKKNRNRHLTSSLGVPNHPKIYFK